MEILEELSSFSKKHESNYKNQLLLALRAANNKNCANNVNTYEQIVLSLRNLCQASGSCEEMEDFFRDIGVDRKTWLKIDNTQEKFNFIIKNLEKCIEENKKKVNIQIDNFIVNTKKNPATTSQVFKQNKNKDSFDWLKLKNKYPMCQPKLKAKLVQAISDNKNENRIRDRINQPDKFEKVTLLDESLILDQYQKIKIDYKWTEEDQKLFISNINGLKNKFNQTQFLKKCGRFRFISDHELQTLAAQEISRRLDQSNKVYLSRQFLLDKYYSTTQFLTEQEMRFILKTSPLLSKCVDKNFIRSAIKNIQYQDINKLQLKIAENIISRFDQIRKAVKESRKLYKQSRNNEIKERIVQFEKKQQFQIIQEIARQELKKHKLNTYGSRSTTSLRSKPMNLQNKKKYLPLNQYHPPSGLFVKDCNEQCNDDLFNHYEKGYIQRQKRNGQKVKNIKTSMSMMQFYTGGPDNKNPIIPLEAINTICSIIKAQFYQKSLKEALESYEIPSLQVTTRTQNSFAGKQMSCYDLDRRPKTVQKINQESNEAAIKKKILENKQKAKAIVYVNKMLAFAAQNSYTSFKALNAKYTVDQINTKDHRGNTALYYAAKNQNLEFMNHLLNFGADSSMLCQKDNTPLHHIFKTNNINLIIRCLCSHKTPNLNALNSQNKTPLAYSTHDTLTKLYLQDGVLTVQNRKVEFDNNYLLTQEKLERLSESIGWQNGRINTIIKLT